MLDGLTLHCFVYKVVGVGTVSSNERETRLDTNGIYTPRCLSPGSTLERIFTSLSRRPCKLRLVVGTQRANRVTSLRDSLMMLAGSK